MLMVRKSVNFTNVGYYVLVENGKMELRINTFMRKLSEESALRHLKKIEGKALISQSVKLTHGKTVYEMPLEEFITRAEKVNQFTMITKA